MLLKGVGMIGPAARARRLRTLPGSTIRPKRRARRAIESRLGERSFPLMSKLKTKRSAAKRFRTTGSGKILRNHAYHRHQLTHKSTKLKVGQRGTVVVADADVKLIKRMLPYSS
jgi:large subunit ribosomal protein L35